MPGGDRTGPMGAGPMTGRGLGYCGGSAVPGFAMGGGWGMRGRGRGWRHWFHATGLTGWQRQGMGWPGRGAPMPGAVSPGPKQELEILQQQAEAMSAALQDLQSRINHLKGQGPTE